MKIVYVAPSTVPSETANSVQVMKVCQALTRLGHEINLIVPGLEYHDRQALKDHYGISADFSITWLSFVPALRKVDFAWQAVRLAERSQAELVYTRIIWVALFALVRGLPVVLEMHEVPSGSLGPLLYRRYLNRRGRKLTVFITHGLKSLIESRLKVDHREDESCIAPDGVDLERYQDLPSAKEARRRLGLAERFTAVYSGGFYPGRGLEILLELAARFPQAQFLCIGGSPEVVRLWQQQSEELALKNVRLTGFIANADLPQYQAAGDVLLMPYRRQVAGSSGGDISAVTSPMKAFEYLACGRAILCSDLPVLHEVLNEKNAEFYPPDDLEGLTQKFGQLINDPKLRQSLSDQARRDAVKYSWDERMKSVLSCFEK